MSAQGILSTNDGKSGFDVTAASLELNSHRRTLDCHAAPRRLQSEDVAVRKQLPISAKTRRESGIWLGPPLLSKVNVGAWLNFIVTSTANWFSSVNIKLIDFVCQSRRGPLTQLFWGVS
jgi:hypothetical protein